MSYSIVVAAATVATLGMVLGVAKPGTHFNATVVNVVDGDTIQVSIARFKNTPWDPVYIRISGIDTPEVSTFVGAKCTLEVARGKTAQAFARSLVKPGDRVRFTYRTIDKYGNRLDGDIKLHDGRDWGQTMLKGGYAKVYTGVGPRPDWCQASHRRPPHRPNNK